MLNLNWLCNLLFPVECGNPKQAWLCILFLILQVPLLPLPPCEQAFTSLLENETHLELSDQAILDQSVFR